MPLKDKVINKANPGPFGSTVTNFAAVRKAGSELDSAGEKDFTKSTPEKVTGSTMFCEGSIGKVRYAGLAYMLDEEGVMDLQTPAGEFFASEGVGKFFEKKYPGQGETLQTEIGKLFSGDSAQATLADLTTHRSGVGDLTRDQARLTKAEGVEREFSVPDLLLIPEEHRGIPRDSFGKPRAQSSPQTPDEDLPDAKYGAHQYSNLGYVLLGLAMEASYDAKKNPTGEKEIKDYKQLTRDYMLHPAEGRAFREGLEPFNQTKFPKDLEKTDDVARSSWLENGRLVDATQFSGANAAGGILSSADDSERFFAEFFKGFSGEADVENKFFSKETIQKMKAEGDKFPVCGVNKDNGNQDFQLPGFVAEKTPEGELACYKKGGGTFGYASFLRFDAKTNHAVIDMCAQENLTGEVGKKWGVERGEVFVGQSQKEVCEQRAAPVLAKYRDPISGEFNRREMIDSELPVVATQIVAKEFVESGVSDAISSVENNSKIPAADVGAKGRY
ncbi:MAG: serine hydrolase [Proteobacteria bacterium]|nr:serine hydrolase [Pseudomonadota bacterium]